VKSSRTKNFALALGAITFIATAEHASAFYDPSLGRWINRDPIGEAGGLNLYTFVQNRPVNAVDRNGLDIWIIIYPDFPYHHGVIGDDGRGGYWYTDFGPTPGSWAIYDDGYYGYTPTWSFPPDALPDGLKVGCHIRTTPDVDQKLKDKARLDAQQTPPKYFCLGYNCWSYSNEFEAMANQLMNPLFPPFGGSRRNAPPPFQWTR
jgi:uncharacterized protein RhaS with RHS repeats